MNNQDEKITEVATRQKLGLGIKVLLTTIVLGAVAAGVYVAFVLSR